MLAPLSDIRGNEQHIQDGLWRINLNSCRQWLSDAGASQCWPNGVDFDFVGLIAQNGDHVALQLNNGNGDGSDACYCVRVETNGGSGGATIYSSNIALAPGHRYSYSLLFDEVGDTFACSLLTALLGGAARSQIISVAS